MSKQFVVILCIINNGFSETAMDAAKQFGAKGGTVIHGRGTASKEAEKFFNISIQPEKEIVLILVNKEDKEKILHSIYQNVGLNSPGQGIAFTVPVDQVVGIGSNTENRE